MVAVDLLLKLQFRMMSPRTTLKQIPVLSRLFYHSSVKCVSAREFILEPVVGGHYACEEGWLGGVGGGVFVDGDGEGEGCEGDVETALRKGGLVGGCLFE